MIRVVRLVRARETKTTVIFEEENLGVPPYVPVFGPQGRIYLSKDVVGDSQAVLVKVEVTG